MHVATWSNQEKIIYSVVYTVKLSHTSPRRMGFPRNDREGTREIAGSSPFPPSFICNLQLWSRRMESTRNANKIHRGNSFETIRETRSLLPDRSIDRRRNPSVIDISRTIKFHFFPEEIKKLEPRVVTLSLRTR